MILLLGMGTGFCLPKRLDDDDEDAESEENEEEVSFLMFFKNKRSLISIIAMFL